MKNIAIFASGEGTNADKIIEYFSNSKLARVVLVVSNNRNAGVLDKASKRNIPTIELEEKKMFADSIVKNLLSKQIDLVVLAGFLWMIPKELIQAFPDKIINIHPALLPKYGGKGMYGMNVHQAVIKSGEKESGITVHYVNEFFDEGEIIFQEKCAVAHNDTPETLSKKVQQLEHQYYPKVIEKLLSE